MTCQLFLGDCLEIMRTFAPNCIDLTVTSPPYDNLRAYKGYAFDFEGIAYELYRIMKPGGVVVWVVGDATINGNETGTSFRQALYFKDIGFNLHDTMIYCRESPPLTHNRYEQYFEYMFILAKGKPAIFNPIKTKKNRIDSRQFKNSRRLKDGSFDRCFCGRQEEKIIGNIWKFLIGGGHTYTDIYKIDHPAMFPEALARDHILSWSNPGDVVFDPMMGSGTTGKMAIKYHRNFIGCEIAEEYLKIAERRIHDAEQQMLLPFKENL